MNVNQLSVEQVGRTAKYIRKLRAAGRLTHAEYSVIETQLFSCRKPGSASLMVSIKRLMQLAGVARATVVKAIKIAEILGIYAKIKHRVKYKGVNRQASNEYVFRAVRAESTEQTPYRVLRKTNTKQAAMTTPNTTAAPLAGGLEAALARLGGAMREKTEQ